MNRRSFIRSLMAGIAGVVGAPLMRRSEASGLQVGGNINTWGPHFGPHIQVRWRLGRDQFFVTPDGTFSFDMDTGVLTSWNGVS